LPFFGHIYEKKSFLFFSFVFELLYCGASRKKKKIENRFLQIARFLGGVPLNCEKMVLFGLSTGTKGKFRILKKKN
jgi:hypothetical protein